MNLNLGRLKRLEIDWRSYGTAASHYSWAYLIGVIPGVLYFEIYGLILGWLPVLITYGIRQRHYSHDFEPLKEQATVVVSVLFSWLLWYAGPMMWLAGWSRDYFSAEDVETGVEELDVEDMELSDTPFESD
ncbi:MAG: hypothetical protein MUP63_02485 [Candidatus Nanohaloarchaeota archaeon QJJ-7]|nr:hypothetical protein [Candidatus Nanohaloarchaeota archaeon QJJ-7]